MSVTVMIIVPINFLLLVILIYFSIKCKNYFRDSLTVVSRISLQTNSGVIQTVSLYISNLPTIRSFSESPRILVEFFEKIMLAL
jgi:hypothetical protein